MELSLGHKIELIPTYKQKTYFQKACGVARFAWNWGLAHWQRLYEAGEKPNGMQLKKAFNAIKRSEYPWVYEVTKYACQQPFLFLQKAFNRFFKKQSRYPQFKKKGVHDSFYIGNDQIKLQGTRVFIPNLGWVKMREALRFSGKVLCATVSRVAHKWFISFNVSLNQLPTPCKSQASVGVDLGINKLATLSNGEVVAGEKPLKGLLKKLSRLQRRLSHKEARSHNRHKARLRLSRLYYRIFCIRRNALHQLTSYLTENFATIVIEDLNVTGMMSNRRLSRAVSDMGFYEFRRQLAYKSLLRGNEIKVVDRWYPSSKRCSGCGQLKEVLGLEERKYHCFACGLKINRDLNAAINLLHTVSSTEFQACGEDGSGSNHMKRVKPASMKQEPDRV